MPRFAPPFRHSLILAEDRVTPSFLVSGRSQSRTRRPAVAAVTRIVTAGRWTRVPEPTFGDAPSRAFILTGYASDPDKIAAIEAGFDAHMTKPMDATNLEKFLRRARA